MKACAYDPMQGYEYLERTPELVEAVKREEEASAALEALTMGPEYDAALSKWEDAFGHLDDVRTLLAASLIKGE